MKGEPRNQAFISTIPGIVLLAGIYVIAGRLGLLFDAVSGFATLVWAPTGIALAALVLFGPRYWPGVLLGAILTNYTVGANPLVALGIGVGNTLEAVIGALVLKKFRFDPSIGSVRDAVLLIIPAAFISTTVSATIGVASLMLGGVVTVATILSTWSAWWIGDVMGDLVFAPLLMVWGEMWVQKRLHLKDRDTPLEALMIFGLLTVMCTWMFLSFPGNMTTRSLVYLIFLPLVWVSLRFRMPGATTAVLLTSVFAIWGTTVGNGPFAAVTLHEGLLSLQLFMGTVSVTALLLAATITEKARLFENLRRVDQAKSEFVSLASHQLRTPPTAINWFSERLLSGKVGKLTPKQREYFSEIRHSNERMIELIDALLNVSRIDLGVLAVYPGPVVLRTVVHKALSDLKADILERKIQIRETYPPTIKNVQADKHLLYVIIHNLLTNAIHYSPVGGTVSVRAVSRRRGTSVGGRAMLEDRLILIVSDNGYGIPDEQQGQIFTKFFRADNVRKQQTYGTGLGLFIVKSILDKTGGDIWFQSQENKGTTFYVAFPLSGMRQQEGTVRLVAHEPLP